MPVPAPTSAHSATGASLTALPASTIPTMVSRAASLHNSLEKITQKVESAHAGVNPTKTVMGPRDLATIVKTIWERKSTQSWTEAANRPDEDLDIAEEEMVRQQCHWPKPGLFMVTTAIRTGSVHAHDMHALLW